MSKSKNKKVNPRNIPRTQADCDKQWRIGCLDGIRVMEAIFLRVLIDKHSEEVDVKAVWDNLTQYTQAWADGDVTVADIRNSLKEEDKIMLMSGPSNAYAHDDHE